MNPHKFNALSTSECETITQHLLDLESRGLYEIHRVDNSPAFYNPSIGLQTLYKLRDKISKVVGLDLQPTYSYGRIYRNGNKLPKHIDRKASEFGVSITTHSTINWPIYFDVGGNEMKVVCDVGEGIIYKGSETPHWRNDFKGELQVQLLVFYVDSNGQYSDLENDKFLGTNLNKQIPNL